METKIEKERYLYISAMQVIGILLVFLGHATRIFPKWAFFYSPVRSDFMHGLNMIIYSFHMPLFVFISGFLMANSFINSKRGVFQYVKDRFVRLIIPFYLFAIFWNVPLWHLGNIYTNISLGDKIKFIFQGMNSGHLWFLAMLFCLTVIFVFIEKFILRNTHVLWGILIFLPVYFLNIHGKFNYYYIFRVNVYIIYFYFGYLCFCYKDAILNFIEMNYLKILLCLGTFWGVLETQLVSFGKLYKIEYLSAATLGILLVLTISKLLEGKFAQYLKDSYWFNFIAVNSFLLYVFHEPIMFAILRFINYGKGLAPIETVSICFFGAFFLSYLCVVIYKKITSFLDLRLSNSKPCVCD